MSARSTRRGLGKAYRHMGYAACPCRWCSPSTPGGRRWWKRQLHHSARQAAKRDVDERRRDAGRE